MMPTPPALGLVALGLSVYAYYALRLPADDRSTGSGDEPETAGAPVM
jgi:hypothetical protein